jgi:hypothetical protein
MSTVSTDDRIIPDTLFYSFFRNTTDHTLYVWWAGSHGMNVPPGERFRIIGDPRVPPGIPKAHGVVESIRAMLREGVIEFCSSPSQVLDNRLPDGRSMALVSQGDDPHLDMIPFSREELAARTLPDVTPACTWDPVKSEILIDWSTLASLDLHDRFLVTVTPPGGETVSVKCGVDRQMRYTVQHGPGLYKIRVTLTAVDQRTREGTEVEVTVPDP